MDFIQVHGDLGRILQYVLSISTCASFQDCLGAQQCCVIVLTGYCLYSSQTTGKLIQWQPIFKYSPKIRVRFKTNFNKLYSVASYSSFS